MGLMLLRFSIILFLLISGLLLSSSFAGGSSSVAAFADDNPGGRSNSNFISELAADADAIREEGTATKPVDEEEVTIIHERLLRANTRDYGNYDPTPALSKPPFKLIPN